MHQQILKNPPLKIWQGLIIVIGLVAALFLDSVVAQLLAPLIGGALSSMVFWGLGVAIALFTMHRFVMCFSYAMNGTILQVTFVYGRYRRLMEEIYVNSMLLSGAPDDLKKRFPGARVHRALRKEAPVEEFALAYRDDGRTNILILQPDETLREMLIQATKKKK